MPVDTGGTGTYSLFFQCLQDLFLLYGIFNIRFTILTLLRTVNTQLNI